MEMARKYRRVVIFFDEINTNEHVSGLLKEIIVNRSIYGEYFH